MGKWTKAAKALKEQLDKRESMASDMEVIVSQVALLPLGQLKKVLNDEVIAIFEKYGIKFE